MEYPFIGVWRSHTRGNISALFAVLSFPVLVGGGFALDIHRQVNSQRHLQSIADAAALAGARALHDATATKATVEQIALDSYTANIQSLHGDIDCDVPNISADMLAGTIKIEASCGVPTMFGPSVLTEEGEMGIGGNAEAVATFTPLELALMLDVSKSMRSRPITPAGAPVAPRAIDQLKAAAAGFAERLIGPHTADRVRIAIVPFASGVNPGAFGNKATGRAVLDDPERDGAHRVCVTERLGTEALTDAEPEDGLTYVGQVQAYPDYCPSSEIMPLTNDFSALETHINGLSMDIGWRSAGGTAGHMGIMWSWYALSPEWADVWSDVDFGGSADFEPQAYGTPHLKKVAILMSDGSFDREYSSEYGYTDLPTVSEDLCNAMRAEGIIIYTVALSAGSSTEDLFLNCAGSPDRYYIADGTRPITDIYAEIASEFIEVALSE